MKSVIYNRYTQRAAESVLGYLTKIDPRDEQSLRCLADLAAVDDSSLLYYVDVNEDGFVGQHYPKGYVSGLWRTVSGNSGGYYLNVKKLYDRALMAYYFCDQPETMKDLIVASIGGIEVLINSYRQQEDKSDIAESLESVYEYADRAIRAIADVDDDCDFVNTDFFSKKKFRVTGDLERSMIGSSGVRFNCEGIDYYIKKIAIYLKVAPLSPEQTQFYSNLKEYLTLSTMGVATNKRYVQRLLGFVDFFFKYQPPSVDSDIMNHFHDKVISCLQLINKEGGTNYHALNELESVLKDFSCYYSINYGSPNELFMYSKLKEYLEFRMEGVDPSDPEYSQYIHKFWENFDNLTDEARSLMGLGISAGFCDCKGGHATFVSITQDENCPDSYNITEYNAGAAMASNETIESIESRSSMSMWKTSSQINTRVGRTVSSFGPFNRDEVSDFMKQLITTKLTRIDEPREASKAYKNLFDQERKIPNDHIPRRRLQYMGNCGVRSVLEVIIHMAQKTGMVDEINNFIAFGQVRGASSLPIARAKNFIDVEDLMDSFEVIGEQPSNLI